MKTTATFAELDQALAIINKKYTGNISLYEVAQVSRNRAKFRLKSISRLNGSCISHSGKNTNSASWHVHGDFFEALFSIREDIVVFSLGKKITKDNGNWEDRNVGRNFSPLYASEASIEQDDLQYFWDKVKEVVEKIQAGRVRKFDKAAGQLREFASHIKRIFNIQDITPSFEDNVKLNFIESGDITKLKF